MLQIVGMGRMNWDCLVHSKPFRLPRNLENRFVNRAAFTS